MKCDVAFSHGSIIMLLRWGGHVFPVCMLNRICCLGIHLKDATTSILLQNFNHRCLIPQCRVSGRRQWPLILNTCGSAVMRSTLLTRWFQCLGWCHPLPLTLCGTEVQDTQCSSVHRLRIHAHTPPCMALHNTACTTVTTHNTPPILFRCTHTHACVQCACTIWSNGLFPDEPELSSWSLILIQSVWSLK